MQAMVLYLNAPSTPWVGSNGQNIFSESSHIAYLINRIETYDNMQANILPFHTPLTPGWDLKVVTFFLLLKVVLLHIK